MAFRPGVITAVMRYGPGAAKGLAAAALDNLGKVAQGERVTAESIVSDTVVGMVLGIAFDKVGSGGLAAVQERLRYLRPKIEQLTRNGYGQRQRVIALIREERFMKGNAVALQAIEMLDFTGITAVGEGLANVFGSRAIQNALGE